MRKHGRPRIKSELSIYSPPSLPPELIKDYLLLDRNAKKLFNKAFDCLWRDAFTISNCIARSGASSLYWAVDRIREGHKLTPSEFSMLTFIYYASGNGNDILHSDSIYHAPILPSILPVSKRQTLTRLAGNGFVIRLRRNPSAPFLAVGNSQHPVFIKLSDKSISIFKALDADIYNILMRTSLHELIEIGKQKTPAKLSEG